MTVYQTQTEYASHRGITQQRVSKLIKQGKLVGCIKVISGQKRIDRDKADVVLEQNLDKVRNRPKAAIVDNPTEQQQAEVVEYASIKIGTLSESQALKAAYDAAITKIKLEEMQGDLIKKTDVEKEAFDISRRVRDSILNIPDRISADLASDTSTHSINNKLTKELIQALEELAA